MSTHDLYKVADTLNTAKQMPVLFLGHGSPMNAIEYNEFSGKWNELGKKLPKPKAILCISAHWETRGTFVTSMQIPKTIHDFGGFPKELFDTQYPAPGNPSLAKEVKNIVSKATVGLDFEWGIDHGSWSVLKHLYPLADVPVIQLSIDYTKSARFHYALGKELAPLRQKEVLIIGSGNMVHNLRMARIKSLEGFNEEYGYDWALEINDLFKKKILAHDHEALINYESLSKSSQLAIPTPEHYIPLLYALGLQEKGEKATIFNDKALAGSLTMTSVIIDSIKE